MVEKTSITPYLDDFERRQREAAAARRKEHFATTREVPDLEFFPPDCPICWLMTDVVDDGWLTCEGCDLSWPPNGYGNEALRSDGSEIARV